MARRVGAGLAGVGPDVAGQVFVVVEEAVVEDGDDGLPAPGRDRPGPGDVGVDPRHRFECLGRGLGRRPFDGDRPAGIQNEIWYLKYGSLGMTRGAGACAAIHPGGQNGKQGSCVHRIPRLFY